MALFTSRRSDGTLVKSREAFNMIMPFIMPTRAESLVFYNMTIDVGNVRAYIHKKRQEGLPVSLFHVVIAACVRTLEQYPRLNRFIAGKRLYQRNSLDVCYVVKREMSVDGDESVARVTFPPGNTMADVIQLMSSAIEGKKEGDTGVDDKLARALQYAPRFLLTFIVWVVRKLDFFGLLPKGFRDELPFYCSLWVSNLGSLGLGAPNHHLYEMGTCSVFLTMGRMNRRVEFDEKGARKNSIAVDFSITVDERVTDGFYLSRAIACFNRLMQNPQELDVPYTCN